MRDRIPVRQGSLPPRTAREKHWGPARRDQSQTFTAGVLNAMRGQSACFYWMLTAPSLIVTVLPPTGTVQTPFVLTAAGGVSSHGAFTRMSATNSADVDVSVVANLPWYCA